MTHPAAREAALPSLETIELDAVTGGLDVGAIAGQIGGLVDSFTGGTKGAQVGGIVGQIAGLFQGGR